MKNSTTLAVALVIAALAMVLVAGCGGGGSTPSNVTTGSVSGTVMDFFAVQGVGGAVVTIGGQQATSASNGSFTVSGILPGGPYTVTVTPPTGLKLLGGVTIQSVNVVANQTYVMPYSIWLVNASEPDPPVPPAIP